MSTIESQLRELYERLADREPPPSRVDVPLARQRGRARLRLSRAGMVAAPCLAAVVVATVAIAVAAVGTVPAPANPAGGRATRSPIAAPPTAAPRQFNPLVSYASFGWLPPGYAVQQGLVTSAIFMLGVSHGRYSNGNPITGGNLLFWAAGQCTFLPDAVVPALNCGQHRPGPYQLPQPPVQYSPSGIGPRVDGRRSYWVANGSELAWQYAPGGWALLTVGDVLQSQLAGDLIKIARNLRVGDAASRPIAFSVQITGLPRSWRVTTTEFAPTAGKLLAFMYSLSSGNPATGLSFTVGPAGQNACGAGQVIDGYPGQIGLVRGQDGRLLQRSVSVPCADGLNVRITKLGRPVTPLSLTNLFAHLRLLGTDPARWTTRPLR